MASGKNRLSQNKKQKLAAVKLFLTDVDGVLTDGGMYYTAEGLEFKKFNVKDGMGAWLAKNAGIRTGIISTDTSAMAAARARKLGMDYIHIGVTDKAALLKEICHTEKISLSECAFIGDDVNDLAILALVGFSAAPADAVDAVKQIVQYVCTAEGGKGAYREIVDLLIAHRD